MNRIKPLEVRLLLTITLLALGSFACGGARPPALEPEFEFDAAECALSGKCGDAVDQDEDSDLVDLEAVVPRPLPTIARNR